MNSKTNRRAKQGACSLKQSAAPSVAVQNRRKRFNAVADEGLQKYDKLWKRLAKK